MGVVSRNSCLLFISLATTLFMVPYYFLMPRVGGKGFQMNPNRVGSGARLRRLSHLAFAQVTGLAYSGTEVLVEVPTEHILPNVIINQSVDCLTI